MKYSLFMVMFFVTSVAVANTITEQPQSKVQAKPAVDTSKKTAKRTAAPLPPLAPKAKKDTAVKSYKKH